MDEVVHALRIKGRATVEDLATAVGRAPAPTLARLRELEVEGLVVEFPAGGPSGWMLSPTGRDVHARQLRQATSADRRERLAGAADAFMNLHVRIEHACASWQASIEDERRDAVLAELRGTQADAARVLTEAAETARRFGGYRDRLARALERADRDPRYVMSPAVDSYHAVWSECHDDFAMTLGRESHQRDAW
jgi:hypothetical protein